MAMSLRDLLEKGQIDIEDDISFRTHADVLRLFGRDVKIYQKAMAAHPEEPGLHVWFPALRDEDDNVWENAFGVTEDTLFERRKFDNDGHLQRMLDSPDLHRRVLFAKVSPFGSVFYKFKGIYELDPILSQKAKKAAYRRTATTAKLFPASKI